MRRLALIIALSITAQAQTVEKHKVNPAAAEAVPSEHTPSVASQVAPTLAPLTELEKTKLQNVSLQAQLLQTQAREAAQTIQAQRAQIIAEIVAAHPGYKWQDNAQGGGLVPLEVKR